MHIITRKRPSDFEEQYERIVALLDQLIDEVGEDETHPYASLMELLAVLIEPYETEYVAELTTEQ